MRTMAAPLLAAQKSASRQPYVKVEAHNRVAHTRRLAWTRLYTGGEADSRHGMVIAGDGSLCRIRAPSTISYARVASPDVGSNFSSWTTPWGTDGAPMGICGNGNRVLVFATSTAGQLRARESTDYGATFGAPVNVGALGDYGEGPLAAAMAANGDTVVVVSNSSHVLRYAKRTAGVWGAFANVGTAAFAAMPAIGGTYASDYDFVVAYQEATSNLQRVDTIIDGDGYAQSAGTWSALREVYRGAPSSQSNVTLAHPFVAQGDLLRLSFVENFAGTVAYKRPNLTHIPPLADYSTTGWREPIPFNLDSSFGLALGGQWPDYFWATSPSGVWRAPLADPGLDVSDDILELTVTAEAGKAGRLRMVLDNSGRTYNTLPSPLAIGAELWVYLGYGTASGNQAANPLAYWIDEIEYVSGDAKGQCVIYGRDGWGLLEDWIARRQYTFTGQNVFQIHNVLMGRVGFAPTAIGSQSSHFTSFQPAFTVAPGESGAAAVRRLLQNVQDQMIFVKDFCYTTWPQAADASVYSYGGAGNHPILDARYAILLPRSNRVQVFGSAANFAETVNWDDTEEGSVPRYGRDRVRHVHDQNLTSGALMTERYNAEQRDIDMRAAGGELLVPVCSGQDVYDVIAVTDPAAGKSAALYRVLAHVTVYDRKRGIYQQRLTLGAP
jgi:hypothetical protein